MLKIKKILNRYFKYLLIIIIFYFIGRFIFQNLNELKQIKFHINYFYLFFSILGFIFFLVLQSLIWHYITIKNDIKIPLQKSIVFWFYSMLGKYIPGKVFLFTGRLYVYRHEKISKKKITLCFFIENISGILAVLFISLFSLLFFKIDILESYKLLILSSLIGFFIIIHPKILQLFINSIMKILQKENIILEISYKNVLEVIALYIVDVLILGLSFFVFINSIYKISIKHIFFLTGSISIAGLIGILSLFAPSGIGVREGILILMLKNIIPNSITGIVAITSRLWITISEIFCLSLVFIFAKIYKIKLREISEEKKIIRY